MTTWPSRTAEYGRHRRRMQAYGRWEPYVDAEPARQHVLKLRAAGMGPKRISEVSGVPHGSLAKLIYGDPRRGLGPSKRIRPETEAKILGVQPNPESLYPGGLVAAHGARRRLQALAVMGYSGAWLADRISVTPAHAWKIQHGRVRYCEATTHLAIADVFRAHACRLHDGPRASVTRENARSNGWESVLVWEDIDALDERVARARSKPGPKRGDVA